MIPLKQLESGSLIVCCSKVKPSSGTALDVLSLSFFYNGKIPGFSAKKMNGMSQPLVPVYVSRQRGNNEGLLHNVQTTRPSQSGSVPRQAAGIRL